MYQFRWRPFSFPRNRFSFPSRFFQRAVDRQKRKIKVKDRTLKYEGCGTRSWGLHQLSACFRSAIKSSESSTPREARTVPGLTPARCNSLALML
jgi:hypothetical protein